MRCFLSFVRPFLESKRLFFDQKGLFFDQKISLSSSKFSPFFHHGECGPPLCPAQVQAHFISSGTRSAQVYPDTFVSQLFSLHREGTQALCPALRAKQRAKEVP